MKEVSDRTVSIFLVIAIVSTLGGFATIVYTVGDDFSFISGFATVNGSAEVTLTVTASTTITILNGTVAFGTGTLSQVPAATAINTSVCGSAPSGEQYGDFDDPCGIVVRNDGTIELNITLNGSTAAQWLDAGSTYEFGNGSNINAYEANSCGMDGINFTGNATERTPFANNHLQFCQNLTFSNSADQIVIDIYVNLSNALLATSFEDSLIHIEATGHE